MVSCSMYFRRMIRVMAMAAVVLLLSGCSAALTDSETPDTVLPGLPESTTAPAATGTTLPQASPETEEPSEQPEEKEPCGFLPPAGITVSFRDEAGIFMARNQHLLALSPEDEAVTFQADSPDGSACALLTSRNQLWLIRGQQLTAVGECNGFFALSADGSALIYTDQGGILLRYACDSGESTSISAAVSAAAISPDGNSIAYSTANPDGSTTAWIWSEGTARLLGEELLPFALSNHAQLVYALGVGDRHLHILDETGAAVTPSCPLDSESQVFLSSNHRQILFRRDSTWCLSSDGSEAAVVTEAPLKSPVIPRGYLTGSSRQSFLTACTLPTENLWGNFFLDTRNILYYLEPDHIAVPVSENVREDSLWVSRDGSTVFYLWADGTLFRTQRNCPGSPTILAGDIADFSPTADMTGTYCLDTQGTLWYLEDFHDPRAIREDVTRMAVTWDDYCLYLTESEEDGALLWACQRSTEGLALSSNVTYLRVTPTAAYYIAEEEELTGLFCATDGFSFVPLQR